MLLLPPHNHRSSAQGTRDVTTVAAAARYYLHSNRSREERGGRGREGSSHISQDAASSLYARARVRSMLSKLRHSNFTHSTVT